MLLCSLLLGNFVPLRHSSHHSSRHSSAAALIAATISSAALHLRMSLRVATLRPSPLRRDSCAAISVHGAAKLCAPLFAPSGNNRVLRRRRCNPTDARVETPCSVCIDCERKSFLLPTTAATPLHTTDPNQSLHNRTFAANGVCRGGCPRPSNSGGWISGAVVLSRNHRMRDSSLSVNCPIFSERDVDVC